jgi:hypothetical protein
LSQEGDSPSLTPEELITQVMDHREALYSGDVTLRGRETRSRPELETSSVREIHERFVFDLRTMIWRHEKFAPGEGEPKLQEVIVNGPEDGYTRRVATRQIAVNHRAEAFPMWDLRIAGMCTYNDLLSGTPLSAFATSFQQLHQQGFFQVAPPDAEGLIAATLSFGGSGSSSEDVDGRRRIWFSEQSGFTPVRMEEQFRASDRSPPADEPWQPPHSTAITEWAKRADTWVPTAVSVEYTSRDLDGKLDFRVQYELALQWDMVNEELDSDLFSLESLDVPPQSHLIADFRSGDTPVIVQHPAPFGEETSQRAHEDRLAGDADTTQSPWTWSLIGLIAILVAVFVGIGFVLWPLGGR